MENWTDLDEVLLGEGYIHTGRFYIENGYAKSSCGDDFNILHLMSDEMIQTSAEPGQDMTGNSDQFAFITWQRDTGVDDEYRYRGGDEKYWNTLYTRINVCNMVIALIDEQPEKTPDDTAAKERIKGEAYFLRGLYYFMLTNLYCEPYNPATADATRGMPLKFTEYVEDIEFNRATLASILSTYSRRSQRRRKMP